MVNEVMSQVLISSFSMLGTDQEVLFDDGLLLVVLLLLSLALKLIASAYWGLVVIVTIFDWWDLFPFAM
jgi:hypothetical protein